MIKKHLLGAATVVILLSSCQNQDSPETLSKEAIAIHDEIMPQIRTFDRTSSKIDSILVNLEAFKVNKPDLDTSNTRVELQTLKSKIESAVDFMMDWMHAYNSDSLEVNYQKNEIKRVTTMKKQFEEVNSEIELKMKEFN